MVNPYEYLEYDRSATTVSGLIATAGWRRPGLHSCDLLRDYDRRPSDH
jgi:hypothetical protein